MKGLLVVEYILRVIEGLLCNGDAALDLHDDVYERYNTELDAANRRMAWGAARIPQPVISGRPGARARCLADEIPGPLTSAC